MPGPPRPSFPSAPSEPSLRRLGVGGGSSGDRPIRAQVVVALVAVLILLAVPLYLLRRPPEPAEPEAEPAASAFAPTIPVVEPEPKDERLSLAEPVRVKCGPSAKAAGQRGSLCDQLPFFESALSAAIRQTVDCAPRTSEEGAINYVLQVDFDRRSMHVFPGASGKWKGPQARRAATCVKQALPTPNWDTQQHQYRYYEIAIMTTYPQPAPTGTPLFE